MIFLWIFYKDVILWQVLNIFRGYLQEKGLRKAEHLTSKVKLANACMQGRR